MTTCISCRFAAFLLLLLAVFGFGFLVFYSLVAHALFPKFMVNFGKKPFDSIVGFLLRGMAFRVTDLEASMGERFAAGLLQDAAFVVMTVLLGGITFAIYVEALRETREREVRIRREGGRRL